MSRVSEVSEVREARDVSEAWSSMSFPYHPYHPYPEQIVGANRHTQRGSGAFPVQARQARASSTSLSPFVKAATCPVCDAVYAPTSEHEVLLHAPTIALESAFMSMCRFCFRCRRPSCPACWDSVHGLCGACVEALALPFRQELPPFESMSLNPLTASRSSMASPSSPLSSSSSSLPPVPSSLLVRTNDTPLRCVYAGRFEQASFVSASSVHDSSTARTTDRVSTTNAIKQNESRVHSSNTSSASSGVVQGARGAQKVQDAAPSQISRAHRIAHSIERIFTTLILIALTLAVVLVVVAAFSTQANTWLAQVLHIDIRGVILTLWATIRQLLQR